MAIPIGETPILKGKAAKSFLKQVNSKPTKCDSVRKERERAQHTYEAIKKNSNVWL